MCVPSLIREVSPTNLIQHPQFLGWYQLTSIKTTQIVTRHASNMTFSGLISPEPMLVMLVADVHNRFTDFYIYNVTCILMFNAMQQCYICKHQLNNTRIRISSGKYIYIHTYIYICNFSGSKFLHSSLHTSSQKAPTKCPKRPWISLWKVSG